MYSLSLIVFLSKKLLIIYTSTYNIKIIKAILGWNIMGKM